MMASTLWKTWSRHDLQEELKCRHASLLDEIEPLLPAIADPSSRPPSLSSQTTLTGLVEAFLPEDAFSDASFRRRCLNRLTPDTLEAVAVALSLAPLTGSFSEKRDVLVALPWNAKNAAAFVEFFGLPSHFCPSAKEIPRHYIDIEPASYGKPAQMEQPFKQLKDYQFDAYCRATEQLSTPFERFVIQMPTGSGKTRTAMEIIASHLNEWQGSEKEPLVIWLAHSSELCEQATQCFLEVWAHLARRPLKFFRAWGPHPLPILSPTAACVVTSFQKLHSAMKRDGGRLEAYKGRATLLVLDEAHRMMAPTYERVVNELIGTATRVIGLTATPGRTVHKESIELASFFNDKRLELEFHSHESPIEVLKKRGVLARARYTPLLTNVRVEISLSQRSKIADRFAIPEDVLNALATNQVRNLEILKRLYEQCGEGRQVLFFACSVAHSKLIASLLQFAGISAAHVDGETGKSRRRESIEQFRSGDVQVLSNFGVLSTGFDAPNTDVVFISRPTLSPVLYSQMIGRGLRGPAMGGTATCSIVDVRDNIVGFGELEALYTVFDEYFDSVDVG